MPNDKNTYFGYNRHKTTSNGKIKRIVMWGGRKIAKLLLLFFDQNEDDLVNDVIAVLHNSNAKIIQQDVTSYLSYPGLYIDFIKRVVYRNEKEIYTTFIEFEVLSLLARNPGRTFSKEQIYQIVWKDSYAGDYHIVMSHIKNIRKKIEDNPGKPMYIQTVWGVGYQFNKNLSSNL